MSKKVIWWGLAMFLTALPLSLTGCGGSSSDAVDEVLDTDDWDDTDTGTDDSTDTDTDTGSEQSDEPAHEVDSPQTLAEAMSFEGGFSTEEEIERPANPQGGDVTVSEEMAITAGGVSSLSVQADVPEGQYVHAYIVEIEGSGRTFVIPVDENGEPQSNRVQSLSLSDNVDRARRVASSGTASVQNERRGSDLMCNTMPNMSLEGQPMQEYEAPAQVQAYTSSAQPAGGDWVQVDFLDSMGTDPVNWTRPASTTIRAVDVGGGQFQVTLAWDTTADVDLHLTEPDGNKIYYAAPNSAAGDGYLDRDDTDGFGPENIYFEENIPAGEYTVEVHMFSGLSDELPTDYTVTVKQGGSVDTFTGTLVEDDETDLITTLSHSGSSGGTDNGSGTGDDSTTDDGSSGGFDDGTDDGTDTVPDIDDSDLDFDGGTGDLELGSCGVSTSTTVSICYTDYPLRACDILKDTYSSTADYDVISYTSTSGCGGGYSCQVDANGDGNSVDSIDFTDCIN